MKKVFTFLAIFFTLFVFGQNWQSKKYLVWTGEIDNDFFNEQNWREATTDNLVQYQQFTATTLKKKSGRNVLTTQMLQNNMIPATGTLDPGIKILHSLYIKDAELSINDELIFDSKNKEINIHASKVAINSKINQGSIQADLGSTLNLVDSKLLANSTTIQINDADSWLLFERETPDQVRGTIDHLLVVKSSSTPRLRS